MRRLAVLAALILGVMAMALRPQGLPENGGAVKVVDRSGAVLYERPGTHPLGHIPPALGDAVVAIEDRRFYGHSGVDILAIARAARDNLRAGRVVSGASTIPMQVARMIRARQGAGLLDKVIEAQMAIRLDLWNSKDDLLTYWLEHAYFGRGAFGLEAASGAWFGKSPVDLTLAEAAFLAGLPQRPERVVDGQRARQRQVLDAMVRTGTLDSLQALDAAAQSLTFSPATSRPLLAPHLSIRLAAAATSRVTTTLDGGLQARVEALARAHTHQLSDRGVGNVAALVIDNPSGAVLAYLGSADYFDEPAEGANDGVRMLRQPGSALKPFIYGAALDRGLITPASILMDVETPFVEAGAAFSADNYDRRYHGAVPARRALASSFNIPAVGLVDLMGAHAALGTLHRAGFESLNRSPDFYGVGLALGNGEVTLIELARAYAGLARGGMAPPLHVVEGEPLLGGSARSAPADVAFLLLDILSDPEARAPGFGRGGPLELPFPLAAKTGTSKDYRDNWAIGVTPGYTIAVWAGNFDGAPMQSVSGVSGAGTLMHAIALELGGRGDFPVPAGVQRVRICTETGLMADDSCAVSRMEWILERHLPLGGDGSAAGRIAQNQAPSSGPASGRIAQNQPPVRGPASSRIAQNQPPLAGPDDTGASSTPAAQETVSRNSASAGSTPHLPGQAQSSAGGIIIPAKRLAVRYPADGMVFQLDPVLRREHQRVRLQADVPPGWTDVRFLVDGTYVENAQLTLDPSIKTIQVEAQNDLGVPFRSRPSRIRVLAPPVPAGQ